MKTYRINEIFYSLQGEGRWAGSAAIFVRFSGCNLKCPFCDTDFSDYVEMTANDLILEIVTTGDSSCKFIVLTGGEPTLQADHELIDRLHDHGYYVAMETNGTNLYPWNIDYVTFSPKDAYVNNGTPKIVAADEIKIVFDGEHEIKDYPVEVQNKYLQPCDTGDEKKNKAILDGCIEYIKKHPDWQLSLQQQKIINVR